jgi:ATP-binding cassette subfamily B protein
MTLKRQMTQKTIALLWQHAKRHSGYVWGVGIAMPITVLVEQYIPPIIIANVLNRLAKGDYQSHDVWASFGPQLVLYAVLLLLGSVGWRVIDYCNWKLEGAVLRDIAQRIYGHLLDQSAGFHANRFGGSLVSQANKLMSAYVRIADTTMYQVFQLFIGIVFTAIILAPRAPLFVAVLLVLAAVFMVSGSYITRTVRQLTGKQASQESKQTGYLADSVTNIMAIKSFAGSDMERKQYAKITNTTRSYLLDVLRANQKQTTYFSLLSRVISISALTISVVSVTRFHSNVATAFLIFTYTSNLVERLWGFCNNSLRNYNRLTA